MAEQIIGEPQINANALLWNLVGEEVRNVLQGCDPRDELTMKQHQDIIEDVSEEARRLARNHRTQKPKFKNRFSPLHGAASQLSKGVSSFVRVASKT